jgi:plasmid stabilization system protein ParE
MKKTIRLAERAQEDLLEIWEYISVQCGGRDKLRVRQREYTMMADWYYSPGRRSPQ